MSHLLFSCVHGSRLYGTETPDSDADEARVILPSGRDLLLGRLPGHERTGLGSAQSERPQSRADAEDSVLAPFHRIVEKVLIGEPNSVEMLFAPEWSWLSTPDLLWLEFRAMRKSLVTRNVSRYASFAYDQANRHGIVPRRFKAACAADDFFRGLAARHAPDTKLIVAKDEIAAFFAATDHGGALGFEDIWNTGQSKNIAHIVVCERRYALTQKMTQVSGMIAGIRADYGDRTRAALTTTANWKALSTALRVAGQAIELLETGDMVFPRPDADYLRAVKLGKVAKQDVVDAIERELAKVASAKETSDLPDEADRAAAEALLIRAHLEAIRRDPALAHLRVADLSAAA